MINRGIDTDNYDAVIPVSHFKALHDEFAVNFNIIGLEALMPYAQDQKVKCESVGISVPFAYKFLYWADNDIERMKHAASFGEPIAIDCEYETSWSPNQVVERISKAKEALIQEGLYWGIYTGSWWWPSKTGNSQLFKNDKLWHAEYPYKGIPPVEFLPNPSEAQWVNYGGWTKCDVWQYANKCYGDDLGPWDFDMNSMDIASVPTDNSPVEPRSYNFTWISGNSLSGFERRNLQTIQWNNNVEIYAYGSRDGKLPGQTWYHAGSKPDGTPNWEKLRD